MSALQGIATVLAVLAFAIRVAGRQHRLLHLFQLEHYEPARLMLWLRRRSELFAPRELAVAVLLSGGAVAAHASSADWLCAALLLLL
ncbi:MAG TPA: hypothetical protein VK701_03560, partial [Solirubrobacteraceae bacterium]|nr:hypothetical protein [Solirubrobacteraceae bacterium]